MAKALPTNTPRTPADALPPTRDHRIDCIKALAILGVVMIHTCSASYASPLGSFDWISGVFWGSLSRASVPLFFMCSGVLLLNPEKPLPLPKLFSKNIARLLVAMLVWAFLYKLYHLSGGISPAALWQALKEVLLFQHEFHFYYIHIILLVYVALPITRLFVRHASQQLLQYALLLWFVLGILYPTLRPFWPFQLLSGIPVQWMLSMTYSSIGYGLLGFYLRQYPPRRLLALGALLLGFCLLFGGTLFVSLRQGALYLAFWEGMTLAPALYAFGIFSLMLSLRDRGNTVGKRLGKQLSVASFCIYLVHVFFLYFFEPYIHFLPCLFSIPLLVSLNTALSFGVYSVLSRLPVVKRWLI